MKNVKASLTPKFNIKTKMSIYMKLKIMYIYIYISYVYPQTLVLLFPGLISVARVNDQRTTDVTRVVKALGAELCQSACGMVNEQKIFCSHQCYPACFMKKFRSNISEDTCLVIPRTHQCEYNDNEQKTTDVTRVLKALGIDLCQSACGGWTNKKYSVLISVLQSAQ